MRHHFDFDADNARTANCEPLSQRHTKSVTFPFRPSFQAPHHIPERPLERGPSQSPFVHETPTPHTCLMSLPPSKPPLLPPATSGHNGKARTNTDRYTGRRTFACGVRQHERVEREGIAGSVRGTSMEYFIL